MFPSWHHVLKYQEVLKFALGLSKQPLDLIEFIYGKLVIYLRCGVFSGRDVVFLNSLGKELSTELSFNLFRNKYINYITKDNPEVYIPSKLYILDNNTPSFEAVAFPTEHSVERPMKAECSVFVSSHLLQNVLSILGKIQEWLIVSASMFCVFEESTSTTAQITSLQIRETQTALLKRTLRLNENTSALIISDYNLSQPAFSHIAAQLRDCISLQLLAFIDMQQYLPRKLGYAIATLKSLIIIKLHNIQMTSVSGCEIMKGLSQCQSLQVLEVAHCTLTDCLEYLLGGVNHAGLPSLRILQLRNAKLSKNDIKRIGDAANIGIIANLQDLYLSTNQLFNCIESLIPLGNECQGFKRLKLLRIHGCRLSEADIKNLSQAMQLNKLPSLEHLDVGSNHLTGQVGKLLENSASKGFSCLEGLNMSTAHLNKKDLRDLAHAVGSLKSGNLRSLYLMHNQLTGILGELFPKSGLPFVGLLDLQGTELNYNDLNSLSRAVQEGKLPHLRKLFLFGNNLVNMETEFKSFLKTCAAHFRKTSIDIRISLDDIPNAELFRKEILSICEGTSVLLAWTKVKKPDTYLGEILWEGSFPLQSAGQPFSILLPSFQTRMQPVHPFNP